MLTGTKHGRSYATEEELVADFSRQLSLGAPLRVDMMTREFDYGSGRVDVIASSEGSIHAFEAKLSRWREALQQATRARSFADFVYVVIPHTSRCAALRYRQEFVRRGVGIVTVGLDSGACLELRATSNRPPLAWLTERAHQAIIEDQASVLV